MYDFFTITAETNPVLSFFDIDIALVVLPKQFQFNDYVKPICLPNKKEAYLFSYLSRS